MNDNRLQFLAFNTQERQMYGPFTFGDLYGYEGEKNAVTLSPWESTGFEVICQHPGGSFAEACLQGKETHAKNTDHQ